MSGIGAGRGGRLALRVRADPAEHDEMTRKVRAFLESAPIAPDGAREIMIVVDELASNIERHAWPQGGAHEFGLSLAWEDCASKVRVTVAFEDDGIPFDPRTARPPAHSTELDDRPIGGLGLELVRSLSDGLHYSRRDGRNRTRVHKLI
jgi:serine/threonine-protein kinase RsbW